MGNIGRNDECPCGSGKKFKHCHLGKEDELAPPTEDGEAPAKTTRMSKTQLRNRVVGGLAIALVGGVATLFVMGHAKWGVGVLGAGIILLGIVWVAMDPPPPSNENKNPSGLNFGG